MSNNLTPEQIDQALSRLAGRFEQWRGTRTSTRERIPESLWAEAVSLTEVVSINRIARRCRLSPGDLKKHCDAHRSAVMIPTSVPAPAFVELPPPGVWSPPSDEPMLVELERPDGSRMRLRYRHTPPPLESLVEAFLGAQ